MLFPKNIYRMGEVLSLANGGSMKFVLILFALGCLISCASHKDSRTLSQRIESEQVRSLQEIKSHTVLLLDGHPELSDQTKSELNSMLDRTMLKLQSLKDEESRILQLLLTQSLKVGQPTDVDLKDKVKLEKRLNELYQEKSENILGLVKNIVTLSEKNVINDSVRHDLIFLIRELR